MSDNPIGHSWYRDGYCFEPLADGRVRIGFVASNMPPRDLIIDAGSWAALKDAIDVPVVPWSDRGRYAR